MLFKDIVSFIVLPLYREMHLDFDIAWAIVVGSLQTIIKNYDQLYVSIQYKAKLPSHARPVSFVEEDVL